MDSSGYQQPVVDTRLFDILAYLGLCPFVIGLLLQITEVSLLGIDARLFFTAYSAVILSFLCGVWWGGALNRPGHPHRMALVFLSNLIALAGWVGLLLYQSPWGLPILAIGFAFVAWMEARLNPNLPGREQYFRTRSIVTYLVIACHLGMMLLS
ncbi:DUF3429 domain-containing protein [Microbulbifer sp. THAF38]|uniref:DUF3429 domain-containing protein n=1 Tax=unclassified Microbulbifer TaxID=2619833 RepID=UPI001267FBFE|nr:DUF3429 domain-containing protein [Microbulbifer sp. THAF38]QFT54535.1 hypothetical protein FIU95_08210 [Microbulbifer sp. THAF38]